MRMFKRPVQQVRSENLPTPHTSHKGSGRGCPLLRASNEHILIVRVLRARRAPRRSPLPFSTSSLSATRHVVDKRPVNVGATEADGVKEGISICNKVLLVREFIGDDLGVADITQHHQPTRYADSLSSGAPSHCPLHRSFLPCQPKIFSFKIDPADGTFIDLLVSRKLDFRPIDSPTADMIESSARVFVI